MTEELKKQSTGASLQRGTRRAGISNEEGADQKRGHHGPCRETRSYWPWSSSETVRSNACLLIGERKAT